jgi:cell division protein FtsW (lipid II flippase)
MLYNPARRESPIDQALVWTALLLGAFGLVMVYSASVAMADAERFTGFRPSYFLVRHGVYIAIGLVAAVALSPGLEALLFGVTARDPLTYVSVGATLAMVALLACYVPAARATRIDPLSALRCD